VVIIRKFLFLAYFFRTDILLFIAKFSRVDFIDDFIDKICPILNKLFVHSSSSESFNFADVLQYFFEAILACETVSLRMV
jgi:hypothetical protein